MSKPYELEQAFRQLEPNMELLQELYRKNQQEYIRRRLKSIELLWKGASRADINSKLDVSQSRLIEWIRVIVNEGVENGLKKLAQTKKVKRERKLSPEQIKELVEMIQKKTPRDVGYDQGIFTAKILVEWVEKEWRIKICDQTIYDILHEQKMSYQRGHRDYENGDQQEQAQFVEELKKELEEVEEGKEIYFFDEFSVTNRPTVFYGWAPVNTKFRVPSDEKKKSKSAWISGS
jgi:transposase